jgi:hypothetical protein
MGRASKFLFPFPGRKPAATTKDKEVLTRSPTQLSTYLPKAQRILGTDNDLNIDSPSRDDDQSWGHSSSRSSVSGMSISLTESTRSVHDGASIAESQAERWELESGVLPRYQRLRGKPSSTLLGQQNGEEAGTDTSSTSRRMHNQTSNSTLRSFYDRQKSPLAISQQTSASSSRDLALIKGYPPVVATRSPLLQVDMVHQIDGRAAELEPQVEISLPRSRKKAARLDLSTMFSKPGRDGHGEDVVPPTAPPFVTSKSRPTTAESQYSRQDGWRPKVPPKEQWLSPNQTVRSAPPRDPRTRHTHDTRSELYDKYGELELRSPRSPRMVQIPESRVPDYEGPMGSPLRVYYELDSHTGQSKAKGTTLSPVDNSFSWKHVRKNMINRPWEASSVTSASSQNTKTSRHTTASALSTSNLKLDSVLSLSSGSEDESSEPDSSSHSAPPVSSTASHRTRESYRQSTQSSQSAGMGSRLHGSKRASALSRPSFTIPESHLPSTRISGPWSPPDLEDRHSSRSYSSDKREKRSSKTPSSTLSKRSSRHSTPPLSPVPPIPAEYRDDAGRGSRLMAVTEQEVALLAALRQKKARMREEIIEEHETAKTPPRASRASRAPQAPQRTAPRYSEVVNRSAAGSKERILLYLDAPLSEEHLIDTAEPSPDLSDFLSFGSDEDSTPRSSWAPLPNGQPRPDSSVSPNTRRGSRKNQKKSPVTPPSAARLSAVGAIAGFTGVQPADQEPGSTKQHPNGVQLLEEGRLTNALLMDEHASAVTWAM